MSLQKPEILAPAGDMECALAAFDAGADAVYGGLARFNARDRAVSFEPDDFGRLCQHAAQNGKKVYLTLNTLIFPSEFSEFARYTAQALRYRPDAVIVQDIGVLYFLRQYYPDIRVHASTQMGFHNSDGLKMAHKLGVKRVILERQMTLTELQKIIPASPVETEIFVHGALCASLSGMCLFSSWQNGCSGNRGKCKQPCRRLYTADERKGYFLSPADLSLLTRVPDLMRTGVTSFKIEGRLRKPDYVAAVTAAFRTVVDAGPNDRNAMEYARNILKDAYGRRYSEGFLSSQSMKTLIQPEQPGVQGEWCGTVRSCQYGELLIDAESTISLGDRLRLQSDDGNKGVALTLTKMFTAPGRAAPSVRRGQTFMVPFEGFVKSGDGVYRIGRSPRSKARLAASLPRWRDPVDFTVSITSEGFSATVDCLGNGFSWQHQTPLSAAEKNPAVPERIAAEFAVSGDPDSTAFCGGKINVLLAPGLFIPNSVMKTARKSFWDALTPLLSSDMLNPALAPLENFALDMLAVKPAQPRETQTVHAVNTTGQSENPLLALPLIMTTACLEAILPPFIPETRLSTVHQEIQDAYQRGVRTFRVTSLNTLAVLRAALPHEDVMVKAMYPLPAANLPAHCFLQSEGVQTVMLWPEADSTDHEGLTRLSPLRCEVYRYGRLPVFATRADIPTVGPLDDGNAQWLILPTDSNGIRLLLPDTPLENPSIPGTDNYFDFRHTPAQNMAD